MRGITICTPHQILLFFLWGCDPKRVMASSFLRFQDHTQRRTTVSRTPLDEWSARRRDLYLTKQNTHNKQTSIPPVGFEPTISAGERPQTYVLDRAATETGLPEITPPEIMWLLGSSDNCFTLLVTGIKVMQNMKTSLKYVRTQYLGSTRSDSKVMRLIFFWLYWQYCSLLTQTAIDLYTSSIPTCSGMALQSLIVE